MSAPLATQRTLIPITASAQEHSAVALSPEGDHVAFRGADNQTSAAPRIGVVPYAGGSEVTLISGRNLGSFVWAPDSLGVYFLEGNEVRYVARGGGIPRSVLTLPETGHALWAVKADGTDLFGTWLYLRTNGSQVTRETQIFAVATDGASAPRVLVRSVLQIDGVTLSPDGTKMAYREYDPTPFARRDYLVANLDGSGQVSLTGGAGLGLNPELPSWLPDNSGIAYARIDRILSRAVIERLLLTSTVQEPLSFPTPARNCKVALRGGWIAYEGWWAPGSTWTPMAVPATGGGHVFLDPSRPVVFAGSPAMGGPRGERYVMAGTIGSAQHAQVLKTELVRELQITPRATLGATVVMELPVSLGEAGVMFLAATYLPAALTVPGMAGGFALDPTTTVSVFSGVGDGTNPLRLPVPIPNVAYLRNRAVYLQGVRLTSSVPTGDFTRLVELPVF